MPNVETMHRHDDVLYWPPDTVGHGFDDYGDPILDATYIPLKVRWEERRGEIRDTFTGRLVDYDVVCVVDRTVQKNGVMWKGTEEEYLDTLGTAGTADDTIQDVMEIVEFSDMPDLKGRNRRKVAYLKRKSDTDPSS